MFQVNTHAFIASLQSIISRLKQHSTKTFALLFALGFSLNLILSACTEGTLAQYVAVPQFSVGLDKEKVVRIGHQKFGALSVVKARGDLEKRLRAIFGRGKGKGQGEKEKRVRALIFPFNFV